VGAFSTGRLSAAYVAKDLVGPLVAGCAVRSG